MLTRTLLASGTLLLANCMHAAGHGRDHRHHDNSAPPEAAKTSAELLGAAGREIGTARLEQGPKGVVVRIEIAAGGLTPGWHGVHFHETGDCSDTGAFKLSGAHHGNVEGGHGLLNLKGPEAGDLTNLWADASGAAGYEAFTTLFELARALDADGLAVIVHANADDHMTQPIGGAGPRVACGVIARTGP